MRDDARGSCARCAQDACIEIRFDASAVSLPPPATPASLSSPQALKEHGVGAIEVKRIDALREIAETLSKSRNVVYVPGKGNMMMALPAAQRAAMQ